MNRAQHLQSARDFLTAAAVLDTMPRQSQAVAEMVWGATVAAMSAADPEHNISHHFAPNQQWSFRQVARRIANSSLTLPELEQCMDNNQKVLHTYFYHGDAHPTGLRRGLSEGTAYVARIIATAERSLT